MILQRWQKNTLLVLFGIGAFYGMVYVDVVMRAHEAWMQGEQYWRWADHPEERLADLQQKQNAEQVKLDQKLATGKEAKDDYDRDKELLQFRFDQMRQESSIKYAYVWYQTAVDLFSPPESRWVKLSREKMPLAKERWKAELRAKKVSFEDYMID